MTTHVRFGHSVYLNCQQQHKCLACAATFRLFMPAEQALIMSKPTLFILRDLIQFGMFSYGDCVGFPAVDTIAVVLNCSRQSCKILR